MRYMLQCATRANLKMIHLTFFDIPKVGTEPAVGGAASTKISSNTIRLENILIAEMKD